MLFITTTQVLLTLQPVILRLPITLRVFIMFAFGNSALKENVIGSFNTAVE
jgi:hypothetical protein